MHMIADKIHSIIRMFLLNRNLSVAMMMRRKNIGLKPNATEKEIIMEEKRIAATKRNTYQSPYDEVYVHDIGNGWLLCWPKNQNKPRYYWNTKTGTCHPENFSIKY